MITTCCYFLLFLVAVFAILLHTNAATPQDWEGTYNDPIYGGNIALCVSLATIVKSFVYVCKIVYTCV